MAMDTVSQPATVLRITKNALHGYVMRDISEWTRSVYPLRTMNCQLATDTEILTTLSNLVYLFPGAEFARQLPKFFDQLVQAFSISAAHTSILQKKLGWGKAPPQKVNLYPVILI